MKPADYPPLKIMPSTKIYAVIPEGSIKYMPADTKVYHIKWDQKIKERKRQDVGL